MNGPSLVGADPLLCNALDVYFGNKPCHLFKKDLMDFFEDSKVIKKLKTKPKMKLPFMSKLKGQFDLQYFYFSDLGSKILPGQHFNITNKFVKRNSKKLILH